MKTLTKILLLSLFVASCSSDYYMSSHSMLPGIEMFDLITIEDNKNYSPKTDDIILYKIPGRKSARIHRCIAKENEKFAIKNGRVYINGKEKKEDFVIGDTVYYENNASLDGVVPKGSIIVLGDNREFSADSRSFGYLPVKNIIGRGVKTQSPARKFIVKIKYAFTADDETKNANIEIKTMTDELIKSR